MPTQRFYTLAYRLIRCRHVSHGVEEVLGLVGTAVVGLSGTWHRSTAGLEFELHFVDLGIRLHRNSHLFRPFLQMTSCGNWVTTHMYMC